MNLRDRRLPPQGMQAGSGFSLFGGRAAPGSIPRSRIAIAALAILILFSFIIVQLMNLQIVKGQTLAEDSESKKTKTLTLKGTRGSITDRNGLPLAYDQRSYSVQFYRESTIKAVEYTPAIRRTIEIIEQNGGTTIGGFSIVYENGEFRFDWKTSDEEVAKKRRERWMSNFYLKDPADASLSAQEAYEKLVELYGMEPEISWEEASKVLSIWQDWQSKAYLIKPIPIAENVDIRTVAQIETHSDSLPGVTIEQSSVRVYPRGTLAAHIVGYQGAITAEEYKIYQDMGYAQDDLVGVSGIEKSMEAYLTGKSEARKGKRVVEVNNKNHITREISYTAPKNGNTVMLNIDTNMQQVLERSLDTTIATIRSAQIERIANADEKNLIKYNNAMLSRGTDSLNLAVSGAACVVDVNTGKVLAIASHPTFDPNDFVGGLSEERADYYFNTEVSDFAKASPMYNKAVATRAMPGSIFKMAVGLAGVMEGAITMDEKITDGGYFKKYTKGENVHSPSCWVRPYFGSHANETLLGAIRDSCNYYFFVTADRLGIDKLYKWSAALGLTSKTGIELTNEATPVVGNQQNLYDPERSPYNQRSARTNAVARSIRTRLVDVGTARGINYEDDRINEVVHDLMNLSIELTDFESEAKTRIREILMSKLGLSSTDVSERDLANTFYREIYDIRWSPTETIMSGIGQSITQLTPVSAARYVAAVANGGTVYELQLVDKIIGPDGEIIEQKEPVIVSHIDGADAIFQEIRKGMYGVVANEDGHAGTAYKLFQNFKYKNDIGAKTGSAQINNVDVESNSWFVAFAPFDEPEIAIVVLIPNGYQGMLAGLTAMDILTYYFESKEASAPEAIPAATQWVP